MKLNDLERNLVRAIEAMDIIDAHEHLGPEAVRVAEPVDVFTLFSQYTRGDLEVAGMSAQEYESLFDRSIPLDTRWRTFAPYWERIQHGCYARAALLAAERFYDAPFIDDTNYAEISAAMQAANTPGIYERVLRKACRIRTALTQCGRTDLGDTDLLTPVMPLAYSMETGAEISSSPFAPGTSPRTLDEYLNAAKAYVLRVKAEGTVGLKLFSNPFTSASREEAAAIFNRLLSGELERLPQPNPLRDYVVDELIRLAGEENLVVAVHTGYWGDFRTLDPLHMIPILQRHPKVRFDIYHLGYPWMRECIMLAKGFPNVWLNLCWTHIISQRFVQIALDELLDLIPMNKIIAFGGDYGLPVEKVYGHLVMAREDVARVLARRIEQGGMNESQALDIVKQWFWDNPIALYNLNLKP